VEATGFETAPHPAEEWERDIATPLCGSRPEQRPARFVEFEAPPAPRKQKATSPRDLHMLQARSLNFDEDEAAPGASLGGFSHEGSPQQKKEERRGLPRVKELERYFRRLSTNKDDDVVEASAAKRSGMADMADTAMVSPPPKSFGNTVEGNNSFSLFQRKRLYGEISVTEQRRDWL